MNTKEKKRTKLQKPSRHPLAIRMVYEVARLKSFLQGTNRVSLFCHCATLTCSATSGSGLLAFKAASALPT